MTAQLFAEQGGQGVSLAKFANFLTRLQDGMLKLEFAHYDMDGEGLLCCQHTMSLNALLPALPCCARQSVFTYQHHLHQTDSHLTGNMVCAVSCCLCCLGSDCTAGKGYITGADFANSIVTAADIRIVDKYLDKV
jgi:hypothetical protein